MKEQNNFEIKSFQLEESEKWTESLKENGVVIIRSIINGEEVENTLNLFWEWLQALGTGIKRKQPQTWTQQYWPGLRDMGFFATYGGCHTKASWFLRTHPRVREAFSTIWNQKQLITSFDTMIGWKPWWIDSDWIPRVENLHVDQNPYFKKGLKCVQGMIPLKRVRENEVGGLMVVPRTNNAETQEQLVKRYPGTTHYKSDWLQLKDSDPFIGKGQLVQCEAGDLILWDSRTVHGGKICQPSEEFQQKNKTDFVRLAMTVTMVPRAWAKQGILQHRKHAFKNKVGHTHWPNQTNKSGMGGFLKSISTNEIKYDWPTLTGEVAELV